MHANKFDSIPAAIEHLESLGSSYAIALELERHDVRSRPGCPETCAVAVYLSRVVDLDEWVSVGTHSVSWGGDVAGYYSHECEFGPMLRQFVHDFDCEKFPALIAAKYREVVFA